MEMDALVRKVENLEEELKRERVSRFTDNELLSKFISLVALIGTICIAVVSIMLIISCAIPDLLELKNREFVISILLILLLTVVGVMWLARKNAQVLVTMLLMGTALTHLGIGYIICAFTNNHKH